MAAVRDFAIEYQYTTKGPMTNIISASGTTTQDGMTKCVHVDLAIYYYIVWWYTVQSASGAKVVLCIKLWCQCGLVVGICAEIQVVASRNRILQHGCTLLTGFKCSYYCHNIFLILFADAHLLVSPSKRILGIGP